MAQKILIKRSATPAKIPLVGDLSLGEFALNTNDGKVYMKKNNGVESIVEIGAVNLSGEVTGSGTGSITTTVTNAAVIGKLITGYVSGSGTVAATDTILQAINKLNGNNLLKANIASPVFTGNVTGLGVATGTSFNAITALSSTTPAALGVAAVGTSTTVARSDHVHLLPTPTTLGAQPVDADLTSISALSTTGIVRRTAADTWSAGTLVGLTNEVTGTLPVLNGGTGQTTLQLAINALTGGVTNAQYLRGNGTNVVMSAIQASDVPTLNQNTTGSAATLTTPRTINSVSFNGSANITINAEDSTARVAASLLGVPNGVATLDAGGLVPSTQLPSYVDDVLEYANLVAFPATGETGKIYIALDTNKTYRWSGTVYVYITSGAVDSVAGKTGIVTLVSGDVGLGNVTNTSDANKPVSTAQQTALDLKANIASPVFTGNVTGLGVSTGTSFNSITALSSALPSALGTATIGTSTTVARSDHVHLNPSLDSLSNTTITSNTTGEILKWNGSAWINNTLAEAGIQAAGNYLPISGGELSNGDNVTLELRANDAGQSYLKVGRSLNGSQGTGIIEVTQDGSHGGGFYYNGDGIPTFITGETSDAVTFYRMSVGVKSRVFQYAHNSDVVTFTATPTVNGTSLSTSTHNHTLDSLSNTTITSNTTGEVLVWSGSAWINNTLTEAGIQPAGTYATGTGTASGTNTGDNPGVTSVGNGNGMNFTTFTTTGTVTLGTPSTLTAATTNALTASSHTHAITGFLPLTGGTVSGDTRWDGGSSPYIYDSSIGGRVPAPGGAAYLTGTVAVTGAIKIALPLSAPSDMLGFEVNIYDYNANESIKILINGYAYTATTPWWTNCQATIISSNSTKDLTVRFGWDGSKSCVWIGELASTWSYPQVAVFNFHAGYSTNIASYASGWAITFATAFDSIGVTLSANFPEAENANTATTLQTARTIGISGAVTGTATSFNGSANITIAATSLAAANLTGTIADARISGSYTGMTNLTGSGSVDFAKFLGLATDLVSTPSFTWTGDLTTGLYRPTTSQIGVAIAGVQRALITSTGITATNLSGTNTGDNPGVTSVGNGNGMNFTTFTTTGTVTLGTPSTLTAATTNAVTASSHTHAITGFVTGTGTVSGTNTGDNPGVTSVATAGGYGGLTLTGGTITSTGTITMGGTPTGTWPISVSGSSASATYSVRLNHVDGPRNLTDRNPNWNGLSATFDFVGAGTAGGTGNYAGVLTFAPWSGTTASTGDSSYQLAFRNETGVNASGVPGLAIRNGIDTTWKSWYTVITSGNIANQTVYNSTLAGGLAVGTGVNSSANQIVRTNSSGYCDFGWINTVSGVATGTPTRVYCSQDAYLRYYDMSTFTGHVRTAASGSWGITSTYANYCNGWFGLNGNYGHAIEGIYSSTLFQGVYDMGPAYRLGAGGTVGNLYGIAWSYPSAGGIAGNLNSHGALIMINGGFACALSYSIVASQNVTAYSDERLKENWKDLPDNFIEELSKVKVGTYDRTDGNIRQVGVSAQSLEPLMPEAVITGNDDFKTKSVSYGNAALASSVMLAKEIVEMKKMIEQLMAEVAILKGEKNGTN